MFSKMYEYNMIEIFLIQDLTSYSEASKITKFSSLLMLIQTLKHHCLPGYQSDNPISLRNLHVHKESRKLRKTNMVNKLHYEGHATYVTWVWQIVMYTPVISVSPYSCLNSSNSLPSTRRAMTCQNNHLTTSTCC